MLETAKALRAALVAGSVNSGSAIYHLRAPKAQAYPYIVYQNVSSVEEHRDSVDVRRELWQVRAVSNQPGTVHTLQNAIYDTLNYAALTIDDYTHMWTTVDRQLFYLEDLNDQNIYHGVCEVRILLHGNSHGE